MKKSWIVGSVVTGHVAASLLLTQGCQTARSGRRTAIDSRPAVPTEAPAPGRPTQAPDGRSIRPASEVGRPGTFTEFVIPAPTPTPVAPTPPTEPETTTRYTVAAGDTLSRIALRHGVTTGDLLRLNRLDNPDVLRVGQRINIPSDARPRAVPEPLVTPPEGSTTHTVAAGESVSVIAQRYGVRTNDVLAANQLSRDSVIRVGQTLIIPDARATPGTSPAAPTTVTPPEGAGLHTVAAGESVSVIAQRYGVRTADVLTANQLTRDSVIRVGQQLVIPGAERAAPAPSPDAREEPGVKPPTLPLPTPTPTVPDPVRPVTPTRVTPEAPAETVTEDGVRFRQYTVRENEDVYSVAIKWGLTPAQIRQHNNLVDSELTPGQVLRIPE